MARMHSNSQRRSSMRRGLTLMELLISLVMTGVILVLVSTAMDLQMRSLAERRNYAEEAQLARSVLRRIADDLRSAVQYSSVDVEAGLEGLDASSLIGGLAGGGMGDLGGLADALLGGMSGDLTNPTENLSSSVEPPPIPGLYGNQYELQVDISRLPRVEEYHALFYRDDPLALVDIPSDVKTVTYFVRSGEQQLALHSDSLFEDEVMTGGLMRRHLDRAVTHFAASVGNLDGLIKKEQLLAPEVVGVEFKYFDGISPEWLLEWDTDLMQGLPVAVSITLFIRSERPQQSSGLLTTLSVAGLGDDPLNNQAVVMYQLIVKLPLGVVPEVSENDGMGSMGL